MFHLKKYFLLIILVCISTGYQPYKKEKKTLGSLQVKKEIVFITGQDQGENRYYKNATTYFLSKHYQIIDSASSLSEIINWLNKHYEDGTYGNIHIVSHGNPWRGLSLKTTKEGERITLKSLNQSRKIAVLEANLTKDVKIIFHSCGLGNNLALLTKIKKTFLGHQKNKMYASPLYSVFGGKFTNHYLAKPFYVYYPTANSKGPLALAKELKIEYPNQNIDWLEVLKTRTEKNRGGAYTYKFNIPVVWEVAFKNKSEIPELKNAEEIMDWISEDEEFASAMYALEIPLEKFRWKVKIKGNSLFIQGKTTVVSVLQPVMKLNSKNYKKVDFDNDDLYISV